MTQDNLVPALQDDDRFCANSHQKKRLALGSDNMEEIKERHRARMLAHITDPESFVAPSPAALREEVSDAIAIALAATESVTKESWAQQQDAIIRMAAMAGDFKSANEGMRAVGELFGIIESPHAAKHAAAPTVHFHGASVDKLREAPRDQLEARYAELNKKAALAKKARLARNAEARVLSQEEVELAELSAVDPDDKDFA